MFQIGEMKTHATSHGLPDLDTIDQQCYIFREMLSVAHEDIDLFIRDPKKGNKQRLIYAAPQELEEDEENEV